MLYYRLIYILSMLYVRLTIKVKVRIQKSFKVGWYPHKITGSSHLKKMRYVSWVVALLEACDVANNSRHLGFYQVSELRLKQLEMVSFCA